MKDRSGRPLTPAYVIFFILFSPDTWRIAMGGILSVVLTPHIAPPDLAVSGRGVLYIMVAAIGWAISGKPAQWITTGLKRAILGPKRK